MVFQYVLFILSKRSIQKGYDEESKLKSRRIYYLCYFPSTVEYMMQHVLLSALMTTWCCHLYSGRWQGQKCTSGRNLVCRRHQCSMCISVMPSTCTSDILEVRIKSIVKLLKVIVFYLYLLVTFSHIYSFKSIVLQIRCR